MKKVALALATVAAATVFAPEASAVPAFARQTGMACSACHQQHFPIINAFGRAFKAAGFTMMGSQEKIEGEGLSIPGVLNAAVLMKARFQKTNGTEAADNVGGSTTNSGQWQIPDELSLFFGGRVAEGEMLKVGMIMENNMAAAGALIAGIRVPMVVDLGAATVSVIPYITDALGPFYAYTESSTGVTRGIRWAEHRTDISAHQYTGIGAGQTSGLALVVRNDMGYVNVSKFSPSFTYGPGAGVGMTSTAISAAWTPTLAGWNMIIGAESLSGRSQKTAATAAVNTTGTGFDIQAHGELAGMEAGVYITAANTPADSTYGEKSASTVGVDVTVVPHTLSLGAAYRNGKKAGVSDNAVTLTAVYDLFQNVALHANYSMYSGDAYTNSTTAIGKTGDSLFTGLLEAAW